MTPTRLSCLFLTLLTLAVAGCRRAEPVVNVQADERFRTDAEAVKQLKVRNADGDMAPLGGVIDIREAWRKSANRAGLLKQLKREGIDTSVIERLA